MQPSPLSLNHYQLLEISIHPDTDFSGDAESYPDISMADFESKITFGQRKDCDECNDYSVKLFITGKPKETGSFPYSFNIGVQGFFSVHPKAKIEDNADFAYVNGSTLLYGVIRDTLLSLTCRFEHGAIMIPTVNFLNLKGTLNKNKIDKLKKEE